MTKTLDDFVDSLNFLLMILTRSNNQFFLGGGRVLVLFVLPEMNAFFPVKYFIFLHCFWF